MNLHDVSRTCAAASSCAGSAASAALSMVFPGRRSRPDALWCIAESASYACGAFWCHLLLCCNLLNILICSLRCAKACKYIHIRKVCNCPEQAGVPRINNTLAEQQRSPPILLQTNSMGYTKPMSQAPLVATVLSLQHVQ